MKNILLRAILAILLLLMQTSIVRSQDAILQGFYWNTHPGDLIDRANGGIWWDTLAVVAPQISAAGFQTIWTPPPQKSFAGVFDMGYGPYDYFDMGRFNSQGTTRTRHGNEEQLIEMINAYHQRGMNVMADVVLNHRAGGDTEQPREVGGQLGFVGFNPPSGRLLGDAGDFHPNNFHADQNGPFHNPIFFEDVCYFNNPTSLPPLDAAGNPSSWYFGTPNNMGEMGNELITWGRFLTDSIGFDEVRLDAIKHIEPDYLAKFILEIQQGDQPFALGEFFDFSINELENYHSSVVNSSNTGGVRQPNMSMFDFPLRGALQSILNDQSGSQDLFNNLGGAGLVWGSSLSGFDVVTWLDTHDTDRTGFVQDNEGCEISFGGACLKLETLEDHNPIFADKEDMGYPLLMAAEGRPLVFWKDYFWFNLNEDIDWLLALRKTMANGSSQHIQQLNGFWPQDGEFDFDNNGGNMFAMSRSGLSSDQSDGLVLGINDHPTKTNGVFVNTPFSNVYLKDYSDGFLFQSSEAFADGRAFVKAQPRDYSWYGPTGLYPLGAGKTPSHFSMDASPGGCPQFVVLNVNNSNNYVINGGSISSGDEVAAINSQGQVVGIGRIGQGFQWDGIHDMVIEILGAPSNAGMSPNEEISLVIYDESEGIETLVNTLNFANNGTTFNFSPNRPNSPNRNGNVPSFAINTSSENEFVCNGVSLITGFGASSCVITKVQLGKQTSCDLLSNNFTQELIIFLDNAPDNEVIIVNGIAFPYDSSSLNVVISSEANGEPLDVVIEIEGTSCELFLPSFIQAPMSCNETCIESDASNISYDDGWQSGDTDVNGFTAWQLNSTFNNAANGGHFVFTSTENGDNDSNADGDIDVAGRSWGLYANSGDVSNAIRGFDEPLMPGDELSFNFDNGFIDNGGTVGFGIQNSNGNNLLEFFFTGGTPAYTISDLTGDNLTGLDFTDEGLEILFRLKDSSSYELEIKTLIDNVKHFFDGILLSEIDQSPLQVRFFNANAGSGGERNLYINSLEICRPVLPSCEIVLVDVNNTCPGNFDGSINISVNNGVGPFSVFLNDEFRIESTISDIVIDSLTIGNYNISVLDSDGCESQLENVSLATEDLNPPVINCIPDIVMNVSDSLCGAFVDFTVTVFDDCHFTLSYSNEPHSFFDVGVTTVTAIATDGAGHVDSCSFLVTIVDDIPPILTCPEDLFVSANENCQAVVSWEIPNAFDNCTLDSLTSNFKPGDTFELGVTKIIYTAKDDQGNVSTCSFNIHVNDDTAPFLATSLKPIYQNRRYQILKWEIETNDQCDDQLSPTSVLLTPMINDIKVILIKSRWFSSVKFLNRSNKVLVIAPDPQALWQRIHEQNGIVINDRQLIVQRKSINNNVSKYLFRRDGSLIGLVSADTPQIRSEVIDAAGNHSVSMTTVSSQLTSVRDLNEINGSQEIIEFENQDGLDDVVQLYPNPATKYVSILNTQVLGDGVKMSIINQTGAVIYNTFLEEGIEHINLDIDELNLSNGIYLISLQGAESSYVERLIISR